MGVQRAEIARISDCKRLVFVSQIAYKVQRKKILYSEEIRNHNLNK